MAHGVAAALGVHCHAPHGAACALMLPVALRVNREVRAAEMAELARDLFGLGREVPTDEAADELIGQIDGLCREVGVPSRLGELGVRREQIPDLVAASRGSSMSGNPRELSDAELTGLLEQLL
jgi:alcohol dehydrogenase class IV